MDQLTAKPKHLKQANLSMVRRIIKARETATRAEIARETGISSTTVRSLLAELIQNREIEPIGYDASSGGRKATRYRFQPNRYHGAAICIRDVEIHGLLVNICGEIVECTRLEVPDGDFSGAILAFLDGLAARQEIKSIGLGVPGVVEGRYFWKKRRQNDELYRVDLGDTIARRYGVPVVLENDLNATAIGLGRCYEKEFPSERPEDTNLAYLHFEHGCFSAGFLAGGRVLRGYNNFAGELGLIPVEDGLLLEDWISGAADDLEYTSRMIRIISWVCAALNPQYVALGGPDLRKDCIGPIGDGLFALLPQLMLTELLYVPEVWQDYHEGMACLTANKMFDEVQLVRE